VFMFSIGGIDNYTSHTLEFISFAINHEVDNFHVDVKLIC
jgi:hypothetical protein